MGQLQAMRTMMELRSRRWDKGPIDRDRGHVKYLAMSFGESCDADRITSSQLCSQWWSQPSARLCCCFCFVSSAGRIFTIKLRVTAQTAAQIPVFSTSLPTPASPFPLVRLLNSLFFLAAFLELHFFG